MAERTTGEVMEQRFLEAFLSPTSTSRGDKTQSAVNAGFSHSRAVRQANRILRERGVVDLEATPTPTRTGSLIRVAPRGAAPSKSSWWIGWNPLKLTADERRLAADKAIVSGQPQRGTSSPAGSSAHEPVKSAPSDPPPEGYVVTGNNTLLDRAFCDRAGGSGVVDWANDPRTMLSNAFAASYARPREPKLSDFPGQLGCDRWELQPLRDDPPVSDGRLHFTDERMGDVTGDVVNDPNRQGHSEGEGVTAKFHVPILRRQRP